MKRKVIGLILAAGIAAAPVAVMAPTAVAAPAQVRTPSHTPIIWTPYQNCYLNYSYGRFFWVCN